jgi:hypothetical protein
MLSCIVLSCAFSVWFIWVFIFFHVMRAPWRSVVSKYPFIQGSAHLVKIIRFSLYESTALVEPMPRKASREL